MVTRRGCAEWRGELAARALGVAASGDDAGLRRPPRRLRRVPGRAAGAPRRRRRPPPGRPRPHRRVRTPDRSWPTRSSSGWPRRRPRDAATAGDALSSPRSAAAAAAVVVAVALAIAVGQATTTRRRPVELAGADGVTGSAVLEGAGVGHRDHPRRRSASTTARSTGSGSPAPTVSGSSPARSPGPGTRPMPCSASALPTDDARRIWMTDEDDRVVLDAHLRRP